MSVPVVHFLEAMEIQNRDGEMLAVTFRAVQFLVAIFVEEPAVVESGERVGRGVDLEFLEFLVLHHDRDANEIRGREHVDHGCGERDFSAEAFGKLAAALQNPLPVFVALLLRQIDLRDGMKELAQKLAAHCLVETFEGLDQQIQERVVRRWLRRRSVGWLGHQ